ncbi:hypothetical protein [Leucobacter iarius]|uniref:Type IV toxin-antitoxin system AbiEi family antitoxin domain-containing protein n=1 Tax=Leucobacter iarius TaxID=333963 RepID=A0ABP4Y539_9MICO
MSVTSAFAALAPQVLDRSGLLRSGIPERAIPAAISSGGLLRLRRGWYIDTPTWNQAEDRDRQVAAILASTRASENQRRRAPSGDPAISHRSAATLHDLPIWSRWIRAGAPSAPPELVQVSASPTSRGNAGHSTKRHRVRLASSDVEVVQGIRRTTLQRTLFDLARTEPFPIALACADSALRRSSRSGYRVDTTAWKAWRRDMLDRAAQFPRGPGVRAVRALAELAHPLADSPLESVSRLRLLQLGIDVEPQYPVPAEDGGTLRLDFRFNGLEIFGECDGRVKYLDEDLRGGRTAGEIVFAEKLRHDWICGTTGMRGVRWGAPHAATAHRLEARLRGFHVPVPGTATLAHGRDIADFLNRLPQ